ncbi:MAG TPA: histidine phosphatase family protein [Bryobacteraceae bacterium]|nr:histidine phosphatase family protein [Bryobacteraceae bacterium]
MSTLTLVRHGQAEPFQRELSELTTVGQAQASKLAEYWLRHGAGFDQVYSGELPRQMGTEHIVADAFRSSGQNWPEARRDAAWNEYDASGIFLKRAAKFGIYQNLQTSREALREFQRMFEARMTDWLEGTIAGDGNESWPAFRDRVSGAIRRIMEGPSSRRVAVFTSGGPIGFAVHFALQAPAKSFLDVNWRVRNGSVSEFIFDRERFTLDSFNGIPHLMEDSALRTWR